MLETNEVEENSAVGGNFLRSDNTELIESEDWAVVFSVAIDKRFYFFEKNDHHPCRGGQI
jgi:hypothetical protein